MFQFNDQRFTHMPFAAYGPDGEIKEFCCIQNNGLWKLYRFTGNKWKRLKTGLPEDATECGPTAEYEDGIWKISFIAGGWKGDRRFRLYRMYGLDSKPTVQTFADVGFVWKDRVCYASRRGPITIVDPEETITLDLHGVEYLYRISYNPDCPNELLISGQYTDGSVFSWACHPGLQILKSISENGEPAYKCAFLRGKCWYAQRAAGFEDRHIVQADNLTFADLPAAQYITETCQPTYTRSRNPVFE